MLGVVIVCYFVCLLFLWPYAESIFRIIDEWRCLSFELYARGWKWRFISLNVFRFAVEVDCRSWTICEMVNM